MAGAGWPVTLTRTPEVPFQQLPLPAAGKPPPRDTMICGWTLTARSIA